MNDLPPRGKPPHDVNVLGRWLGEASARSGIAAGRLRRWLGFMVVAGMLDQARHDDDGRPLFIVKGGVAMELRLEVGARATKDLDTAFRDSMDLVADRLDPALRAGYGEFTATRTELEPVKDTGAVRCDIKLTYRTKPFSTVQMEIAATEGGMGTEIDHVPAKPLDHLGLTGPDTVPCVAIRWQIAQKLHACTELFSDRENDRFRDLIDLQLLEDLVPSGDWSAVRVACIEVFEGRAKHSWPPSVTIHPSWHAGYSALAEATGFSVGSVADAAASVDRLISRIDAVSA